MLLAPLCAPVNTSVASVVIFFTAEDTEGDTECTERSICFFATRSNRNYQDEGFEEITKKILPTTMERINMLEHDKY